MPAKQGEKKELPGGCRIEEVARRARTMRLVRLVCDECGYERTMPHVAAALLALPQEPDVASLDEAVDAACAKAALARIQLIASGREQAVAELARRLVDEGFGEEAAVGAIERARGYGWVDDARFCSVFVSNKLAARWGSERIVRELKAKGIDEDMAREALREALGEDEDEGASEVARAIELLRRKPVSGGNVRDKLFRRLVSRGYAIGVASEAVSQFLAERE